MALPPRLLRIETEAETEVEAASDERTESLEKTRIALLDDITAIVDAAMAGV